METLTIEALPYPWTNGSGLSRAMRLGSVWSASFTQPATRKTFKRAFKQTFGSKVIRIDDDEQFGAICMKVLESKTARDHLTKIRRGYPPLATQLLNAIARQNATSLPKIAALAGRRDDAWALDWDRFEPWLRNQQIAEKDLSTVALLVCAFAMSNRTLVSPLLQLVEDCDPRIGEWFLDERPVTRTESDEGVIEGDLLTIDVSNNQLIKGDSTERREGLYSPNSQSPPKVSTTSEVNRQFEFLEDALAAWRRSPAAVWRDCVNRLQALIDEQSADLTSLDEKLKLVRKTTGEVARLPVFVEQPQIAWMVAPESVASAAAQIVTLTKILSRGYFSLAILHRL